MAASIERKVWHVKTWTDNIVADNVIKDIAAKVKGGVKMTIGLKKDGLRVVQSSFLTGKLLIEYVQFKNIYFVTVNRYYPNCIIFIAKSTNPNRKYQILAYRCATSLDAGMFVEVFKELRKNFQSGEEYDLEMKQGEGSNWTLREARTNPTEKRQLSAIVNIHDTTTIVQTNTTNGETFIHTNGHQQPNGGSQISRETSEGTKIDVEVVTHSEPTSITRQSAAVQADKQGDEVSQASEMSLRDELDYLSHELKDIKYTLEKSTGISAEEYHGQVRTTTLADSTRMETSGTVEFGREISIESNPIDAEVIHQEEPEMKISELHINGEPGDSDNGGEARVFVSSDYRSLGTQTIPKNVPGYKGRQDQVMYVQHHGRSDGNHKIYNRTHDNEVQLRTQISPRSTRPRSAYMSTSSYSGSSINGSVTGSLRMPNSGYVVYEQMPRKGTLTRLSTKVPRKIERVYGTGKARPQSVHGTINGGHYIVPEKAFIYRDGAHYTAIDRRQHNSSKHVIRNVHGDSLIIRT